MSRTEIYTAGAVGIGMCLLFDHFHLIASSYWTGRMEARVTFLLGAGLVVIVWSIIARKKRKKG